MKAWMLLAGAAGAALSAGVALAQDRLTLRHTARVEPGRPVLVGDVAAISGPGAERIGALVVPTDPAEGDTAGWVRVELDRVRMVLEEALGPDALLVACSGSACDVRIRAPAIEAPEAGAPPAPAPGEPPTAADYIEEETARGAIARELSRLLAVEPRKLRLFFDDRDSDALDTATAGRVVEVTPAGSSDRMPVSVAVYGERGSVLRQTVRVRLEALREVAVIRRAVERGRAIGPDDVQVEDRWAPPGLAIMPPAQALGSVVKSRMEPGELVERHRVAAPVVVTRGEPVVVKVVSRGVVVSIKAKALSDGREGDEVEFAAESDPTQRVFARVTGPGEAVIWTPGARGTAVASGRSQP